MKGVDEDVQVRCLVRLCCPFLVSCTMLALSSVFSNGFCVLVNSCAYKLNAIFIECCF